MVYQCAPMQASPESRSQERGLRPIESARSLPDLAGLCCALLRGPARLPLERAVGQAADWTARAEVTGVRSSPPLPPPRSILSLRFRSPLPATLWTERNQDVSVPLAARPSGRPPARSR